MKVLAGSWADGRGGPYQAIRNAGLIRLQAKARLEAWQAARQAGGQGRVCPSSHKWTCQQPPPPLGQCLPQRHKCLPPGVHFTALQFPSARSLAAPGLLPAAALVQGLSQQQRPSLLRQDVVPPTTVLSRTGCTPQGAQTLSRSRNAKLPHGADSGPARAWKPHASLAAVIM